ncbi:MAG TPA: hypothetical protein VGK77_19655 [Candidatus Binatia bacterium]
MIILDENIIASQRVQLRKWRIRFMQIGKETGRRGMKDLDEIIPLLHLSRRPTFFTHDLGFFDHSLCHNGYALICLDIGAKESAVYIRRCLRHPKFQAEKQRLGKVILARQRNLSFWEIGTPKLQRLRWPRP